MTIEFDALLRLLRLALGTEAPVPLPAIPATGFDATAFIALVDRHRVAPFLVRNLPADAKLLVPPVAATYLTTMGAIAMKRAVIRASSLQRVLALLEADGIVALSVKGVLLARELYGHIGARHAGDLDLLIDDAAIDRADAALRRSGWRRVRPDFELSPRERALFRRIRHEYVYADRDADVHLDLMWRLFNNTLTEEIRREAPRVVELAGRSVRRLSRETETLYLFIHGARHGWLRLFWLLDVAMLLGDLSIDWERLLARARRIGAERSVRQGGWMACELLQVRLPEALRRDRSAVVDRLVRDGYRHLESPVSDAQGVPWRILYHMRRHDRWASRLRELGAIGLSPFAWHATAGVSPTSRRHYALRPFRWLHRTLRRGSD